MLTSSIQFNWLNDKVRTLENLFRNGRLSQEHHRITGRIYNGGSTIPPPEQNVSSSSPVNGKRKKKGFMSKMTYYSSVGRSYSTADYWGYIPDSFDAYRRKIDVWMVNADGTEWPAMNRELSCFLTRKSMEATQKTKWSHPHPLLWMCLRGCRGVKRFLSPTEESDKNQTPQMCSLTSVVKKTINK